MSVKRTIARVMRRTARGLITRSNRLDPPKDISVTGPNAQVGIDLINRALRLGGRG